MQIPWADNSQADSLNKLATVTEEFLSSDTYIEVLSAPNIPKAKETCPIQVYPIQNTPCWMDPLIKYLEDGELPVDRKETFKLSLRASRFVL